jgi:hypothetical protein
MIPVDGISLVIAHAGKQHATGFGLLAYVFDCLGSPIIVGFVLQWILPDGKRVCGAKRYAAMTADTVILTGAYRVVIAIVIMRIKTALINAHLAPNTAVFIPLNYEPARQIRFHFP